MFNWKIFLSQTNVHFDSAIFSPRPLGKLSSGGSCRLHGWSASPSETRRDLITVLQPLSCDSDSPHLFCSSFSSNSHATCNARLGSVVICDDTAVSGILLNEGGCVVIGGSSLLRYQSLDGFHEWIRTTSNASFAKFSSFLVLILTICNVAGSSIITRIEINSSEIIFK